MFRSTTSRQIAAAASSSLESAKGLVRTTPVGLRTFRPQPLLQAIGVNASGARNTERYKLGRKEAWELDSPKKKRSKALHKSHSRVGDTRVADVSFAKEAMHQAEEAATPVGKRATKTLSRASAVASKLAHEVHEEWDRAGQIEARIASDPARVIRETAAKTRVVLDKATDAVHARAPDIASSSPEIRMHMWRAIVHLGHAANLGADVVWQAVKVGTIALAGWMVGRVEHMPGPSHSSSKQEPMQHTGDVGRVADSAGSPVFSYVPRAGSAFPPEAGPESMFTTEDKPYILGQHQTPEGVQHGVMHEDHLRTTEQRWAAAVGAAEGIVLEGSKDIPTPGQHMPPSSASTGARFFSTLSVGSRGMRSMARALENASYTNAARRAKIGEYSQPVEGFIPRTRRFQKEGIDATWRGGGRPLTLRPMDWILDGGEQIDRGKVLVRDPFTGTMQWKLRRDWRSSMLDRSGIVSDIIANGIMGFVVRSPELRVQRNHAQLKALRAMTVAFSSAEACLREKTAVCRANHESCPQPSLPQAHIADDAERAPLDASKALEGVDGIPAATHWDVKGWPARLELPQHAVGYRRPRGFHTSAHHRIAGPHRMAGPLILTDATGVGEPGAGMVQAGDANRGREAAPCMISDELDADADVAPTNSDADAAPASIHSSITESAIVRERHVASPQAQGWDDLSTQDLRELAYGSRVHVPAGDLSGDDWYSLEERSASAAWKGAGHRNGTVMASQLPEEAAQDTKESSKVTGDGFSG